MNLNKKIFYLIPSLVAIICFVSNFLSTELFQLELMSFAVWFILLVFVFACGWFINNTLGWVYGGKIIFSVIVAVTIVSVIMVLLFSNYFVGNNGLLTESLILYSLRTITLGLMAFFGMAVKEVIRLQKQLAAHSSSINTVEKTVEEAKHEAENILTGAKLKAEKMLFEAEKRLAASVEQKLHIESNLKEFIQAERELLKSYEKNEEGK